MKPGAPLLLALLLLPGALPIAQAQVGAPSSPVDGSLVPDPVERLVSDLQGTADQAQRTLDELAPPDNSGLSVPDVGAIQRFGNDTQGKLDGAAEQLETGPIQTLYYEGFEQGTLPELGWSQEILRGEPPWGIVDSATEVVVRGDGSSFTPTWEGGRSLLMVPKDGRHAATVLNANGRYDGLIDARLISPVVDLRWVRGTSARTDDPYDLLTGRGDASSPYNQALAVWRNTVADFRQGEGVTTPGAALTWLLVTPPSRLERLYLNAKPADLIEEGNQVPIPVEPRYGAGIINLTFYHQYDLPSMRYKTTVDGRAGTTLPAFLDGAFLEARIVNPDGTAGPWQHLTGDTVFEPGIDHDNPQGVLLFDFCAPQGESAGSAPVNTFLGGPSAGYETASQVITDESDYNFCYSRYNGRVQLRSYDTCAGTDPRVDCLYDASAFVRHSSPTGSARVKSHFTLNRYAGHEIQLAWRIHSGTPEHQARETGWFLDAVRVDALLALRDPGIQEVVHPRRGDIVPTTVALQPEVVVRNNGFQPVTGVQVNFTVEEDTLTLSPEYVAQTADGTAAFATGPFANSTGSDLSNATGFGLNATDGSGDGSLTTTGPNEAARFGGNVVGDARSRTRPAKVLLQSNVTLDRLASLEQVTVKSPEVCTACVPGRYRLLVQLSMSPTAALAEGELPQDRVEDGATANNNASLPFQVRDVPAATVKLSVAPESILTDVNEPKLLRIDLRNEGNLPLTGTVQVTARQLDPATLEPLPNGSFAPAGSLFVGPGDLPAGLRLTSYGGPRETFSGNVTWTPSGLPPGVYRLEARFEATPALLQPATHRLNAFVRATPTPYFAQDFEAKPPVGDGFTRDRLPYAGFDSLGWANARVQRATPDIVRLPLGAVTTSRNWTADARDGPLLELSVLGMLAGSRLGVDANRTVPGTSIRQAYVYVTPQRDDLEICIVLNTSLAGTSEGDSGLYRYECGNRHEIVPNQSGGSDFNPLDYDVLDAALPAGHSFLDDYYLVRTVNLDLPRCKGQCQPALSFWHTGDLNWQGTTEEVSLPGSLGSPVKVPGALSSVSPDQAYIERSRGLVEVTPLDGKGLAVRREVLPEGASLDVCAPGSPGGFVCDNAQCLPPGGLPGAPGVLPPIIGQTYGDVFAGANACTTDASKPVTSGQVRKAFTKPVPAWRREVVPLCGGDLGRCPSSAAVALHFQTTVRRTVRDADHWSVDNVHLVGKLPDGSTIPLGFLDTTGDPESNTEWQKWASFRMLRDSLDKNVTLAPQCYEAFANPVSTSNPDTTLPTKLAGCFLNSHLTPPVIAVDGRGWTVYDHAAANQGTGNNVDQTGNQPNPYFDGWFLDSQGGFQPPGREDASRVTALHWGGPGSGGLYPPWTEYTIASGPLFALQSANRPFAEFQTNFSFIREEQGGTDDRAHDLTDAGSVFLARYKLDPADPTRQRFVFDRRVQVVPESGYTGKASVGIRERLPGNLDGSLYDWSGPPGGGNSGFTGASGKGAQSTFVTARFDLTKGLAQGFGGLCLKRVTDGSGSVIRSYNRTACEATGASLTWSQGRAFNDTVGELLENITAFAADTEGRYALEFHAQNLHEPSVISEGYGWVVDDLRIGEEFVANDVGIRDDRSLLFPLKGRAVGPGEHLQPSFNVTNFGVFTQHGLRLHFNVTQQGVQVFPKPATGAPDINQTTPLGLGFPGLRDPNPQKNVTVSFDTEWVPESEGVFTLNIWTEIIGEYVNGALLPLSDENPLNDRIAVPIEVRKLHSLRLPPAAEFPDDQAVKPLIGTVDDLRDLRVAVENLGTLAEGSSHSKPADRLAGDPGDDRSLTIEVRIFDERGQQVPCRPPDVVACITVLDHIDAGGVKLTDPVPWKPPSGGLFTIRFHLVSPQDLLTGDNDRVVKVLVLSQLIPEGGEPWTASFRPEGGGWANDTRANFDAGAGWSFGRGDTYGADLNATLTLDSPVDLTTFRGAVLTVRHAYDFEDGYDGGVVEVSPDGRNWSVVAPVGGYPGNLTSASPEVARPDQPRTAFTGASPGVVTSVIPLGTVNLTRSDRVTLFEDTFDDTTLLAGAHLAEATGHWVEVLSNTTVPTGKAWWVNKTVVWTGPVAAPRDRTTLEGSKDLLQARAVRVPPLDLPLVVSFDEWRGIGLTVRGSTTVPQGYVVPNSVEVALERLDDDSDVAERVVVLPRGAEPTNPYADNYLDWTRRTIVLPPTQVEALHDHPVRLNFRINTASANSELDTVSTPANMAGMAGEPDDTDYFSPHLGWAVAEPQLYFLANRQQQAQCAAAAAQGYAVTVDGARGRCVLFEDPAGLDYASTDLPEVQATWTGAWRTERLTPTPPSDVETSASVGQEGWAALVQSGWRLVDKVGLLQAKPVWDAGALGPARSGHGRVAEAMGSGEDARLVTPLNLRSVAADATLRIEHSFKFSDLRSPFQDTTVTGGHSGGRVEVSTDGGLTWRPLAPMASPANQTDRFLFTRDLEAQRFNRTFATGSPSELQLCTRPTDPGCLDPSDPFAAPGGWESDGQAHGWTPNPVFSTHSPFGGVRRDIEADSPYGVASMSFAGTNCLDAPGESLEDYCGGAEDWSATTFDLSPYAGQEVMLGLHAWFTTTRFARDPHLCIPETDCGAGRIVPRDFWRVDNVTVTGRVLNGQPLLVRLRAFSDGNGQGYGWDVLNVSLLGDRHLRNLGVRILEPAPGAPLLGATAPVRAIVENKGQEGLGARASVVVQQTGRADVVNGGFERFVGNVPEGWGYTTGTSAGIRSDTDFPAAGTTAVRFDVGGMSQDPFSLSQTLKVPPGHWRLVGLAHVNNTNATDPPLHRGVRVTVREATNDAPGFANLPNRHLPGTAPQNVSWERFTLNFTVEERAREVTIFFTARNLPNDTGNFNGTLMLDDVRIEPRAPPGTEPATGLRNGGFEDASEPLAVPGWDVHGRIRYLNNHVPDHVLDISDSHAGTPADGTRALALEGTGFGADDFRLEQALELEAGKYRLAGYFGSHGTNWTLTKDADGTPLPVPVSGASARLVQTLRADDLPRKVTTLWLWGTNDSDTVTVTLTDDRGTVLASKADVTTRDGAFPVRFDNPASIPLGVPRVNLTLTNASDFNVTVRADEYANGKLILNDGEPDAVTDLRVNFAGPLEPRTGLGHLVVGGGIANGDATAQHNLRVNLTAGYPLRQVIDVSGMPARRITDATVQLRLPAVTAVRCLGDRWCGYRIGQVAAQLLDAQGRPLGEEVFLSERSTTNEDDGNQSLANITQEDRQVTFNFTNAFLPPGTEQLQLGLRALNFSGSTGRDVFVRAIPDARAADGENPLGHRRGGYLALDGQPVLTRSVNGCSLASEDTEPRDEEDRHGCDLTATLGYAREGSVTIEVAGAQGAPLVLVQPTSTDGVLNLSHRGSLPFALDFAVAAGAGNVTVRIHADQWQGEAVLDGLTLTALTQPALLFQGALDVGRSAPILAANGTAPTLRTMKGVRYVLHAEVLAVDAAGHPVGELVLGDNVATVTTGPALGPGRVVIEELEPDPNSFNLTTGDRIHIQLAVRNEGANEVELDQATVNVTRNDGTVIFQALASDFEPPPESLALAPLERRTFVWPFIPDPGLLFQDCRGASHPCVYNVQARVTTQQVGATRVPDSTASALLYIGSDFHADYAFAWPFGNSTPTPDSEGRLVDDGFMSSQPENLNQAANWTSIADFNTLYPPGGPCDIDPDQQACGPNTCNTNPALSETCDWMWRKTALLNNTPFRAITMGGDPTMTPTFPSFRDGSSNVVAFGTVFATVRSPAIRIRDMQRPQVIYAERHDFNGPGALGSVYAQLAHFDPVTGVGTPFPPASGVSRRGCPDNLNDPDWVKVEDNIILESPGFRAHRWVLHSVDAGPLVDLALEAALDQLGDLEAARRFVADHWTHLQVCWHLEQPTPAIRGAGTIREWSLDDVAITPYGMGLGPGQRIPITDNVTKDFKLLLKNRGAYTDTYSVRLEEETGLASRGPSNWAVSLLDQDGRPLRDVRVAPGDEVLVTVRVHLDVAPPTLAREGTVDLAVSAISRTTSLLRSTQHLLFEFLYPQRPNLRIAGIIVNDATLSVDKPRTVDVLVQNAGQVAAKGATLEVLDKMDPSFGVAPVELKRLDGSRLPPFDLEPGETTVLTVNWIPHVAGEHNITAIADPDQRILEFNEDDNVLVKPVEVPQAEFPDLLVEAGASQLNPTPGDPVEISLRITNKGGAPADGVQLSVRAGVTDLLPGEPPHVLPKGIVPGETVLLNVTWRPAFPGEQAIIVRAKTFAGTLERLETSGDNVVLLSIKVRSRGLEVGVPKDLPIQPGATATASVEVRNRGDVDDTYRLRLIPPDDWRAVFEGAGESLLVTVGNHSSRNLTVVLTAPRTAEAGPTQVTLRAESENSTEVLEANLVASVPQRFGIRFSVEPDQLTQPGKRFLPVSLHNGGNGVDFVTVRARAQPSGWVLEPQTFQVLPRQRDTFRLSLSIPTSTPEGAYPLTLEAQGRGGDLLAQDVVVQILPLELLSVEVRDIPGLALPGETLQGSLVVRNDGNVPARANLSLSPPAGWRVRLERDVVSLAPGDERTLALGLVVPLDASLRAQSLDALARSGRGQDYTLKVPLRAARADLALTDAQLSPRGALRDGQHVTIQARVVNQGEAAAPLKVAMYLDDQLVGFEDAGVLQPGEEARVNASFVGKRGDHVLLVTADPGREVGEEDEGNNARLLVQRIDNAPGLFAAVPGPEPALLALAVVGIALILRKRKGVGG